MDITNRVRIHFERLLCAFSEFRNVLLPGEDPTSAPVKSDSFFLCDQQNFVWLLPIVSQFRSMPPVPAHFAGLNSLDSRLASNCLDIILQDLIDQPAGGLIGGPKGCVQRYAENY